MNYVVFARYLLGAGHVRTNVEIQILIRGEEIFKKETF